MLPALIGKFVRAKLKKEATVTVWGSGQPKREFMYVDDLAQACIFLMNNYDDSSIINVGTGEDVSVSDLAKLIKRVTGYQGSIVYDRSKPDGMPRKWLDVSKLRSLGYKHSVSLEEGIVKTCDWYVSHIKEKELKVEKLVMR